MSVGDGMSQETVTIFIGDEYVHELEELLLKVETFNFFSVLLVENDRSVFMLGLMHPLSILCFCRN